MGILLTMEENSKKKTNAKSLLKSVLKVFRKDEKKTKELETAKKDVKAKVTAPVISPSATFRDKCEKLERNEKVEKNEKGIAIEEIEDDEEDRVRERLHPQRSRDSGFIDKEEGSDENGIADIFLKLKIDVKANEEVLSEKKKEDNKVCDEVTESLQNLKLEQGHKKEKKEKKKKTVIISRTPIVNKNLTSRTQAHPYTKQSSPIAVNPQVYSGGRVIVEVDEKIVHTALNKLFSSSKQREHELNKEENFSLITDLINGVNVTTNQNKTNCQYPANVTYQQKGHGQDHAPSVYNEPDLDSILDGLGILQPALEVDQTLYKNFPFTPNDGNPHLLLNDYHPSKDYGTTNVMTYMDPVFPVSEQPSVYMTPPGSVSMGSPQSDIQLSPRAHTSSSDYVSSPQGRLTPIFTSDMETFQNISQLEPSPAPEKKMKLKEFKDMQKVISASFSKSECCQKNRKSAMEIFEERWKRFTPEERKNICLNVSRCDLRAAFGVLVSILLSIEKGSDKEDLEYVIFSSICERVLGEQPTWFLGEFGVTLLELAVLRCPEHPALTRYLVQCVRAVRRPDGLDATECLLPLKVDAHRDTLVMACARRGDRFAGALHWLVAREPRQPPLYPLGHCNAEGYSALHVACKMHSTASPRIQIVHVLLEHGRADLWQAAHTGGDTALHLAVNSPACDLQLVLLLFSQVEQKQWKQLATHNNLGFVTPIEYARCAAKSKPNFPVEVLEFMKKLR